MIAHPLSALTRTGARAWAFGALLILLAAGARPLAAQFDAAPRKVRLLAPSVADSTITGTLVSSDAQSLWVRPAAASARLHIPRQAVVRMEVSRGRRGFGARGAVIGALVGAYVARNLARRLDCSSFECGPLILYSALGGAVGGAGTGYMVGEHFRRGPERWEEQRVD